MAMLIAPYIRMRNNSIHRNFQPYHKQYDAVMGSIHSRLNEKGVANRHQWLCSASWQTSSRILHLLLSEMNEPTNQHVRRTQTTSLLRSPCATSVASSTLYGASTPKQQSRFSLFFQNFTNFPSHEWEICGCGVTMRLRNFANS